MRRPGHKSKKAKREVILVDEEQEVDTLRHEYEVLKDQNPVGTQKTEEMAFDDLPLSSKTKLGLKEEQMVKTTEIQAAAITHALLGRDILGHEYHRSRNCDTHVLP